MPTVQLTDDQKAKIRHHLGYPGVGEASSFGLGVPMNLEISFILERTMNKILESALPQLEAIVGALDQIECQKLCDLELLAVTSIGEISINAKEQRQLTEQYDYWVGALENLLVAPRNPFDKRLVAGGNSINARVAR